MPLRRQLSWSLATADMRNDRIAVAAPATLAERIARQQAREENIRLYREAKAALVIAAARPLATAGGYDRQAIMVLANAIVREQMAASPGQKAYRALIGAAMKRAWAAAQEARKAAAH